MITVIVPARDAEKTIGECLLAITHQEGLQLGQDYEVIVVDDGSTDRTAEIAQGYEVKVIRQANSGPAAARNAAARLASGSLLVFTDADCVPTPGWLRSLTLPLGNLEIVGVKGAYLTRQVGLASRFVQLEYAYKDMRMRNHPTIDFIDTFSAAYRKDIFQKNLGFDETFQNPAVEDIEFSFRLARKGYRMLFEPHATVLHYHDRTIWEYVYRKYRIGYWGAYMLRWTAERFFTDSHTAPTQRIEIFLVALMAISIPFILYWPVYALLALVSILLVFLIATSPFQRYIAKNDPQVLLIASAMILARAGSLGVGLLAGFLSPPKARTKGFPCQSMAVRAIKRLLDLLGGAIGLVLSLPVVGIAALAIRLDSKGPVIFKQPRAGEFGKPFTIYKLRTMLDGADQMVPEMLSLSHLKGPAFKIPKDPRITRVGRILRRWSLDELPQFWNVLKGDMSLVGPRPEVMRLVDEYSDDQRQRLLVKPGLTGPVQVNGRGGLDFDQRFQLELDYLRNYSLLTDVKIILRTFSAVLAGEGIA